MDDHDRPEAAPSGGAGRADWVVSVVRQVLSVIPGGCTWLLPLVDGQGQVVDFRVAAAGGQGRDVYDRGQTRLDERLSQLYPSMVDGPLWQVYVDVLASGVPGRLTDFQYEGHQAGVVAQSLFDVSVDPLLGGLLVLWRRLDEDRLRLERTEVFGRLGWAEYDLRTGLSDWSPGMYRIFERDPSLGPMSRAEQGAALLPDDRDISEVAWQTLDSGAASDVTVRFRFEGAVKYLRVLSDVSRDADGTPLKIYALVQDITAREDSRTEIERLSDQLRKRETTALAEHRLAAQLQNMIQSIPADPFPLAGLEAVVTYVPAESTVQVGGDWYHAQDLADGSVALAIGDVAGHGLEAANGMAHLRFGLLAWLSIGIRDPGTLVAHLNQLCRQLGITATAVVAIYDPTRQVLRWARGGHLAPLLARDGRATVLDHPTGLLLGAKDDNDYPVRSEQLQPDDLVLFFTDGLVERRSASAAPLLDRVRNSLAETSERRGDGALRGLRDQLSYASPYDDTCTLTVRAVA
jgi:serine phosphatase RsbU (regulator of sigma subunit)